MSSESGAPVRVRFAPSPTGYPHIGNIRTALFNWIFARHHKGQFILRIEDTDIARKVDDAVEVIVESLRWLGLDWDEGPYFQSQRLHLYHEFSDVLLTGGHAYLCYCSPERLEGLRQEQLKRSQPPRYDGRCRNLTPTERARERARLQEQNTVPVVRFKTALQGETSFHDLIRGEVKFKNNTLNDFILLKSDGYPTYHLANIVDDHLMAISHVLRADEWLSSTPLHILLYQALNWQPPRFAHLPMILGQDRAKLSKRHGATTIGEYKEQGYLPQAMVNFLALLGWSLDDKTEQLSRDELVKYFSLERVSKTGAVFDDRKLEWMNGVYLRRMDIEELARQSIPFLNKGLPDSVRRPVDGAYVRQIVPLLQERAKTLAEIPQLADFFFLDELEYDAALLLGQNLDAASAAAALRGAIPTLDKVEAWKGSCLEDTLRPMAARLNLSTRELFGLLRVATTARTAAPPLFDTMEVLGKRRCLSRLKAALHKLSTD